MQRHFIDSWIEVRQTRMDKIETVINWERLKFLLKGLRDNKYGRPGYSAILMLKTLLIQQWYKLSDRELEESIADRISFRRFLGLSLSDDIPDATTICRFRDLLVEKKVLEKIFKEITNQFEEQGIILKEGTMVDASLIEGRPSDEEKGLTVRDKKVIAGYKAHVGVDEGSGIVRKAALTSIEVHDVKMTRDMISRDEKKVYADKGYDSQSVRNFLTINGIEDHIMRRVFNEKLRDYLTERNKKIGKTRSAVERVFASLKVRYNFRKTRYLGLAKNIGDFYMKIMAYNLFKAVKLVEA